MLPTTQPLPSEDPRYLPPARRRRSKRQIFPHERSERDAMLEEISRKTYPTFDYLISSLLAGLILIAALLLNSPPLFFMASLCASFMAPFLGLPVAAMRGSVSSLLQSIGGVILGGLIILLCGILGGFVARLLPAILPLNIQLNLDFSWPDFLVLTVGVILTLLLIVRATKPRQITISAAISYELYIPLAAAGFGLTSGVSGFWPAGLKLFGIYYAWTVLVGLLVLLISRFRPANVGGYLITIVIVLTNIYLFGGNKLELKIPEGLNFAISNRLEAQTAFPSPLPIVTVTHTRTESPTRTGTSGPTIISPTPTPTLIPTHTPTITDTPMPTPVWAKVHAGERGAVVRDSASGNANIIKYLDNNSLVQLLPETAQREGVLWVRVRLVDGQEGWMLRLLLITATPQPGR